MNYKQLTETYLPILKERCRFRVISVGEYDAVYIIGNERVDVPESNNKHYTIDELMNIRVIEGLVEFCFEPDSVYDDVPFDAYFLLYMIKFPDGVEGLSIYFLFERDGRMDKKYLSITNNDPDVKHTGLMITYCNGSNTYEINCREFADIEVNRMIGCLPIYLSLYYFQRMSNVGFDSSITPIFRHVIEEWFPSRLIDMREIAHFIGKHTFDTTYFLLPFSGTINITHQLGRNYGKRKTPFLLGKEVDYTIKLTKNNKLSIISNSIIEDVSHIDSKVKPTSNKGIIFWVDVLDVKPEKVMERFNCNSKEECLEYIAEL